MNPELELKVSDLTAAEQRERMFSTFNRLVAGQTLELLLSVPAAEVAGLLAEFQDRYGQGFDWWPVDNRFGAFRVLIAEIEATLRVVEKFLDAGDCATVIQTIEGQPVHPSSLFHSHDAKEERMLYPMADQLFTQQEKEDLCRKMQAV